MMQCVRGVCWLLVVLIAASACEPVTDMGPVAAGDETAAADDVPAGDLATFEGTVEPVAREWDDDARLVEIAVRLDEGAGWREASATYMAPDADRMLVLTVGDDGESEQEVALENLGFIPAPAQGLARVPALPDDAVEPGAAAAAAGSTLADCDIDEDPHEVRYATGAPGAWDGTAWRPAPAWSLTVVAEGGGVLLDPDGVAAADPCFAVP